MTGRIETCVPTDEPLSDAEEIYGSPCVDSPRFAHGENVCVWGCEGDAWVHACNAYSGCFGCKRSER